MQLNSVARGGDNKGAALSLAPYLPLVGRSDAVYGVGVGGQ